MLHELLLALRGHRGHIFQLGDPAGPRLRASAAPRVNSALPLFHPAEAAILETLLATAAEFARLESFVAAHGDSAEGATTGAHHEDSSGAEEGKGTFVI